MSDDASADGADQETADERADREPTSESTSQEDGADDDGSTADDRLYRFASDVSHDLKNPLNAALAQLEIARSEHPGEDHPHLDSVHEALVQMNDRIEDALTFAREGVDAVDRRPTDLADVATAAWEVSGPEDGELCLVDLPTDVDADESLLRRLFENLFTNAAGHVGADATVEVGGCREGFYVADDGPGIPPESREAVFERGVSGDEDGTGYGLAIVAAVAAAHEWEVEVRPSERNGGAQFVFTTDGE
jgi:signal transduction histidine kinase